MTKGFTTFTDSIGVLCEISDGTNPFELWGWSQRTTWQPSRRGTHYGAVTSGTVIVSCRSGAFTLVEGMVFCVPGELELGGAGNVFGITALGYAGLFQAVGPIEQFGRLRYIDGCTDSLLVPPQIQGEPCLNHLHFPPHTDQSRHTHPSFRAGVVLRGAGTCRTATENIALVPGAMFYIPTDLAHGFHTADHSMDVIAFHPDSDFGPQHDDHPMINRTLVDGVSASRIPSIRT